MLVASRGIANLFSFLYKPGAIKFQTWNRTTGITKNNAAKKVSLNGVNRGDATAVAIIALPGSTSLSGSDTKVKMSLEKGNKTTKAIIKFKQPIPSQIGDIFNQELATIDDLKL